MTAGCACQGLTRKPACTARRPALCGAHHFDAERCRSGRTGRSRKPLWGQLHPGFESLSLRHFITTVSVSDATGDIVIRNRSAPRTGVACAPLSMRQGFSGNKRSCRNRHFWFADLIRCRFLADDLRRAGQRLFVNLTKDFSVLTFSSRRYRRLTQYQPSNR